MRRSFDDVTLVVMAAGSASRFRQGVNLKKQWIRVGEAPLWLHTLRQMKKAALFDQVIVTADPDEVEFMQLYGDDFQVVAGGDTRWQSLQNALQYARTPFVLVSDAARPCVPESVTKRVLEHKGEADCVVPAIGVRDTAYLGENRIEREHLALIQTPQLSSVKLLKKAAENSDDQPDESSAIQSVDGSILRVEGSHQSHKITTWEDLKHLTCLEQPSHKQLSGWGIDVHAFESGKPMMLGGVGIESDMGFKAHSDGDVAIHALIDALLGAAGWGDIGEWFPDNDPTYAGADSTELLRKVTDTLHATGHEIVNVDLTVMAEQPKLSPYKNAIRKNLSELLCISPAKVNIKATTAEKMGFIGRKEGVSVMALANLSFVNWMEDSDRRMPR